MYFLDSNICLYYLRGQYPTLNQRLPATPSALINIPAIVEAEILTGVEKSAQQITRETWESFLATFAVADFDDRAARKYA